MRAPEPVGRTVQATGARGPTLFVLVGLPGSGKSTYARRQLACCARVSLDDIRLMLSGQAYYAPFEPLVSEIGMLALAATVRRAAVEGFDVVFDATNVTRALRDRNLTVARGHGIRAVAVWLRCPLETARGRNQSRPNPVPEDVITRFDAQFEPPTVEEGFDEVWVVQS